MTAQTDPSAPLPEAVLTLRSRHDFAATVRRLREALEARGITVFADIDQADAALRAGTTLRPTRLLLFGNPKAGTPVMEANPLAALELPLRAVVWEDAQQAVHVAYLDVTQTLGSRYRVDPSLYAPLGQVPALLRSIVEQG